MNRKLSKPFLKWAGGKGQLLNKFKELYPQELINGEVKIYIEPFVGGGAVLFDILQNYQIEKAYINDINKELINCYRCIKADVKEVIKTIRYHLPGPALCGNFPGKCTKLHCGN